MAKIASLWSWLLDGLSEAAITCLDRIAARHAVRVLLDGQVSSIVDRSGREIARLISDGNAMRVVPADAAARLSGAAISIDVPAAWIVHRTLNPIPAESAPFLEAFARHHIERLTPWKPEATYFGIGTTPLAGKPARLAVTIHVVAQRLLDNYVDALVSLRPPRLSLRLGDAKWSKTITVPIGDRKTEGARVRKFVKVGIIASLFLIGGRFALFPWQLARLDAESANLDRRIEARKSVLARFTDKRGLEISTADLLAMRSARPRVVETLEAMSAALPDSAYLVAFNLGGDMLQISGVSTSTADLIPALTHTHRFLDVSFAGATTRLEDGGADRFHLTMRVAPLSGDARR